MSKKKIASSVKTNTSEWNKNLWLGISLGLTVLVYMGASGNKLTNWDDPGYITQNPLIRDLSWDGIKAMFSESYGGNYHPLTALGNAIEFKIWGLKTTGYHWVNLLFHLANTWLVFNVLSRLFKDVRVALVSALFFGIHPMHVESVVWLAERKDVQFTFFFLLAWREGIKYLEGRFSAVFWMFGFLVLSLLSKSTAIVFTGVFPLTVWWLKKPFDKKAWVPGLLILGLSILTGIKALETQASTIQDFTTPDLNIIERLAVAGYGIGYYLFSSLLPVWLCHLHPWPNDGAAEMIHYGVAGAVLLLLIGLYFVVKDKRIYLFVSLFFLITLSLTLQLIPVGKAIMAERYTYLPYILLFAGFAHVLFYLKRNINWQTPLFVVAGIFTLISFNRTKVWKDSFTLWQDAVEKYPNAFYNWFAYAEGLPDDKPQEAIQYYDRCIQINPKFADAYSNRATRKTVIKDFQGSLQDADQAIKLKGPFFHALNNRGVAYQNLGKNREALADYKHALTFEPKNYKVVYNIGNAYFDLENYDSALYFFTKSYQMEPRYTDAIYNRGVTYIKKMDFEKACIDFREGAMKGDRSCTVAIDTYCKPYEESKKRNADKSAVNP